jgi:hypothetical protein
MCVQDGFLRVLQSNSKPLEKPFLPSCWTFWSWGETLLQMVTSDETWVHHSNRRQKGSSWNGTILNLSGRKFSSVDKIMITIFWTVKEWFLWMRCWEWRQWTLMPISGCWWNSERVTSEISLTRIQQKFCFSMTIQGHTEVWGEAVTKFGQCYPSILQPQSVTLSYPPVWSPEGCSLHYKVWGWWHWDSHSKDFTTWTGQGVVVTRHMHTCSLLAQGRTSGQRLCRKTGYGVKPSLFLI